MGAGVVTEEGGLGLCVILQDPRVCAHAAFLETRYL